MPLNTIVLYPITQHNKKSYLQMFLTVSFLVHTISSWWWSSKSVALSTNTVQKCMALSWLGIWRARTLVPVHSTPATPTSLRLLVSSLVCHYGCPLRDRHHYPFCATRPTLGAICNSAIYMTNISPSVGSSILLTCGESFNNHTLKT